MNIIPSKTSTSPSVVTTTPSLPYTTTLPVTNIPYNTNSPPLTNIPADMNASPTTKPLITITLSTMITTPETIVHSVAAPPSITKHSTSMSHHARISANITTPTLTNTPATTITATTTLLGAATLRASNNTVQCKLTSLI